MNGNKSVYLVELLNLRIALFSVWSRVQREKPQVCYYIDATWGGRLAGKFIRMVFGRRIQPLSFRLLDLKDDQGILLRLRIAFKDLGEVQNDIQQSSEFVAAMNRLAPSPYLAAYMGKRLASTDLFGRETLWRSLLLIHLARMKCDRQDRAVLFMEQRPWFESIRRYAAHHRVELISTPRILTLRDLQCRIVSYVPAVLVDLLNLKRYRIWSARRWWETVFSRNPAPVQPSIRLGVDYYGQLNLDHPEQNSDLFFWQQSALSGKDLLVLFALPHDPLNEAKHIQLAKHQIAAVAVRPEASVVPGTRIYYPSRPAMLWDSNAHEASWVRQNTLSYETQLANWARVFEQENIKLYTSWFRYDASHIAITEALHRRGGLSTFYQRAFDTHGTPTIAVVGDVFFGSSIQGAEIERASQSQLRYYISTGFLGDHRFEMLRPQAQALRAKLKTQGAQRIVAFMDEGSAEDARWHTGHDLPRESYAFLCEKVLTDSTLGLVIKPKVPGTLRKRLGPVAEVLNKAEMTKRCVVIEGGPMHGSFPPAMAVLAADLAIHGHLCAGTAATEAALMGVPTLLMDREGWSLSPLYRLGVGRVVFQDWPTLWKTCQSYWKNPVNHPGFGNWSSIIQEADPFRDGRAAERMGTYLLWLLEGLKQGRNSDSVMVEAAERYASAWGTDKVIEFRKSPVQPETDPFELPVAAGGRS